MRPTIHRFKALSDPNRVRILMMLTVEPLCVCEIVEILGLATSTVSKHLSILRQAGFIQDEKEGRWVNYQLVSGAETTAMDGLVAQLQKELENDPQIQADRQRVQTSDRYELCAVKPPPS